MNAQLTILLARVAAETPRAPGLPTTAMLVQRKLDRQRHRLARMHAVIAKTRSGVI